MDPPQVPPTASSPGSHTTTTTTQQYHHQHHHHHYYQSPQRSPDSTLSDDDYVYNEKDAFKHHHSHPSPRGHSHDSVISHPFSPQASSLPSPNSSVSSGRRQHHRLQDIQLEHPVNILPPPRAHFDPEKVNGSPQSQRAPTHVSASNPDVTAILYDGNDKGPEDKAVQLLLYLSGPCTLFSFLITLWTLLSLFIVLLLCPLRLFSSSRPTLGARITTFLAPPLNLQLNLIYSYSSAISYSPPLLVIIHLFSPIVAMGVAVAAWTAAFFWFFSAILGDPAGQDGHNDGKDSILGVRNWWDRWLSRALR